MDGRGMPSPMTCVHLGDIDRVDEGAMGRTTPDREGGFRWMAVCVSTSPRVPLCGQHSGVLCGLTWVGLVCDPLGFSMCPLPGGQRGLACVTHMPVYKVLCVMTPLGAWLCPCHWATSLCAGVVDHTGGMGEDALNTEPGEGGSWDPRDPVMRRPPLANLWATGAGVSARVCDIMPACLCGTIFRMRLSF